MQKNTFFALFTLALLACNSAEKPATVSDTAAPTPSSTTPPPAGNGALTVGSTVYVHAASGLVLRQTPAKDGAKVALLSRDGAPLKVLEAPNPAIRYVAEQIGAFAVGGGWVKVQTADGKMGYLFEGYLSRYPPVTKSSDDGLTDAEIFYRSLSPASGAPEVLPAKPEAPEGTRQKFADGATFEMTPYAGGVSFTLSMPAGKMTPQEALVLFRPLWFRDAPTKSEYTAAEQLLTVTATDETSQLTIQPKGGRLVVEYSLAD